MALTTSQMAYDVIPTPIGPITLIASRQGLQEVRLDGRIPASARRSPGQLAGLRRQFEAYFAGRRKRFACKLARVHGTAFQQQVWQELQRIPYGKTCSYGELARRIGRPGAARAVGAANRANPWAIIVPCHRVIGANGDLTGYGGKQGIPKKRWLLEMERGQ